MSDESLFPIDKKPTYELVTVNGYDYYEVLSAMQKGIRRADKKLSVFWALELYNGEQLPHFTPSMWRRLLVTSAEDIGGHQAVVFAKSCYDAFEATRHKVRGKNKTHRIFITRCVIGLCEMSKNRASDHFQNLIDAELKSGWKPEIPDYAYDIHTRRGKRMGKRKVDFFRDEQVGLNPIAEDEQDQRAYQDLIKHLES